MAFRKIREAIESLSRGPRPIRRTTRQTREGRIIIGLQGPISYEEVQSMIMHVNRPSRNWLFGSKIAETRRALRGD